MSGAEYDGIIIGAGHHGLILGSYLAKAGLKIAVVERRLMYGGGLETHQAGLAGFYHNYHSINHFNITKTPWYRDLELATKVRYVEPRYEFASPHRDGSALVISRDVDETAASIARFSKRDAATFREWNAKANKINDAIFLPERFSEPLPEKERDDLLGRSSIGRDFLQIIDRQPLQMVKDLFENEHVQLLLLFKLSLFGTILTETVTTRSPMGAGLRAFDLAAGYEICVGGSFNLARGLMESFIRNGGSFINKADVERIILEDDRATGVELADGTTLNARQFVASTVDVPQTFKRMIGLEQLPPDYRDKVKRFKHTSWSLLGVHLSLRWPPEYTAAKFDPNVNKALKFNVGCETLDQLFNQQKEIAQGKVPSRVAFGAGSLSVLDPTQAPPGQATAYAWHVMPYAPGGDPTAIEPLKEEFADRMMDRWAEYAPNMTKNNILQRFVYTANDYSRDLINMVQGDIFMGSFTGEQTMWNHFGYRTPIKALYMAGSPTHPGGAISGGGGYIAARVIAEDLGITPWWQPVDVRKSLASLAGKEAAKGQ